MKKSSKIYVAGHNGLTGSAICRKLESEGFHNIVKKTSKELDLRNFRAVNLFFEQEIPEFVFDAAAQVGGIHANNSYPADFIYNNLAIQNNLIHCAFLHNVTKLLFMGSSCIYPKNCPQPIKEEYLLSGKLEPTNRAYAIAKIAGIEMCQSYDRQYGANFISLMPTNLYGPKDNFDLNSSHALPALIRKFHEAKISDAEEVEIWGSGAPMREFLYVDDLADACVFLMKTYNEPEIVNVGTGKDISIKDLALLVQDVVGFQGQLRFNTEMPDGTMKKLLDVSRLDTLGWEAKTSLRNGIELSYSWFQENFDSQPTS